MANLFYCAKCKRVIASETQCTYCGNNEINRLLKGAAVNVIGTKQKGQVFRISDEIVKIIITDLAKNKVIREYKAEQLKKII
ncbi:hypothetical protein [Clostridium sp.]|uniref:hypothetical protein n=1 Tax=Clostridium sp. TaxID=1506 RepID=UPI003D6CDAE3